MNINAKQKLWSKYYLTQSFTQKDDLFSLHKFVTIEVDTLKLSGKAVNQKRRKLMKDMLKFLPKKQIMKRYCLLIKIKKYSQLSKSQLIDELIGKLMFS